jgi:hypothetical protein
LDIYTRTVFIITHFFLLLEVDIVLFQQYIPSSYYRRYLKTRPTLYLYIVNFPFIYIYQHSNSTCNYSIIISFSVDTIFHSWFILISSNVSSTDVRNNLSTFDIKWLMRIISDFMVICKCLYFINFILNLIIWFCLQQLFSGNIISTLFLFSFWQNFVIGNLQLSASVLCKL